MTELVRTKVGKFSVENCKEIADINKDNVFENISPLTDVLDYQVLNLDEFNVNKILNGQVVKVDNTDGNYLLENKNDIVAIVKVANNMAKMSIFLA